MYTDILPLGDFYKAEDYSKKFMKNVFIDWENGIVFNRNDG